MTKCEVHDRQRFKWMFFNQGHPDFLRVNTSKVSTPKPQEEKGGYSYVEKPLCSKHGKKYNCKGLVGRGNCYGRGKVFT